MHQAVSIILMALAFVAVMLPVLFNKGLSGQPDEPRGITSTVCNCNNQTDVGCCLTVE
jgi:hypothetical protein